MKQKSPLLALIPDTFEGRLELFSTEKYLRSPQQNRAVRLYDLLILGRHMQVGAALRAVASTGRNWTEETAQKDRQYWADSASMMPGLAAKELWDAYSRRVAET